MDSAIEDLSSDASSGTIQVLKDRVCGRISWINTLGLADPIGEGAWQQLTASQLWHSQRVSLTGSDGMK